MDMTTITDQDKQDIEKGKAILKRVETCAWELGEWYHSILVRKNESNQTVKNTTRVAGMTCKDIAETAGITVASVNHAAHVWREFGIPHEGEKMTAREHYGLPYAHYREVLPLITDCGRPAAIDMLSKAMVGGRYEGEFEDHGYSKPWTQQQLVRAIKIKRGKLTTSSPPQAMITSEKAVLSKIDQAVENLPKTKQLMVKKVLDREVKATFKKLTDSYTDQVDAEVKKQVAVQVQEEKALCQKLMKQAREKEEYYERLRKNLTTPMSKTAWKSLRQFCHPDKHNGNESAARAFNIIQELGNKLGFNS